MWIRNPCSSNVKHLPCSAERSTSIIFICPSFKVCYPASVTCSASDISANRFPSFPLERLTDTLRMNPTSAVSAQIFLMFRVLLLRISSHHLTSLWPIMVTELVRFPSFRDKLTLLSEPGQGFCFWKPFPPPQIRIFTRLEKMLQSEKDVSK